MMKNYFPQRPSRSVRFGRSRPQKPARPKTKSSMLKKSSALKIQKAVRGFLVRRNVKKLVSIRNEVIEIERKLNSDIEFFDLIRKDAKERLRVNETLMSLLFKLDSIHGVDYGVRVLRKSVTKKAIALQEKVDSIGQQTLDLTKNVNDSSTENCIEEDEGLMEEVQKDKGKRELLEKMMDENEKMMKLLMKISETNEMQARMINSLTGRVEQVEKAVMVDKKK